MAGFNQTWRFGVLREVVIDENEATWEIYDSLYTWALIQALFDNQPFHVIGEVDGMTALVRKTGEETIFILYETEKPAIIPVASGLKQLLPFLDGAENMWKDCQKDVSLTATEENKSKAIELLESFERENPGISADFWELHCFAGLNMGFAL